MSKDVLLSRVSLRRVSVRYFSNLCTASRYFDSDFNRVIFSSDICNACTHICRVKGHISNLCSKSMFEQLMDHPCVCMHFRSQRANSNKKYTIIVGVLSHLDGRRNSFVQRRRKSSLVGDVRTKRFGSLIDLRNAYI